MHTSDDGISPPGKNMSLIVVIVLHRRRSKCLLMHKSSIVCARETHSRIFAVTLLFVSAFRILRGAKGRVHVTYAKHRKLGCLSHP